MYKLLQELKTVALTRQGEGFGLEGIVMETAEVLKLVAVAEAASELLSALRMYPYPLVRVEEDAVVNLQTALTAMEVTDASK